MPETKIKIPQGTLDLLILKTLALGRLHGLGVTRRLQQISEGSFKVSLGSVFPALHRMEEAGWLASEWGTSSKNRKAKYYRLTAAGRDQLDTAARDWERLTVAVARLLQAT